MPVKFAFNSSVLDQGLPKGGNYSTSPWPTQTLSGQSTCNPSPCKTSSTNSARPRSGDVLGNVVVVVVCFVCCCCGVVSLLSARVNQGLKYQGLPKGGHYSTVNATSEDSQQGWCVWGVSAWFGNGGGCAGVREEGWGGESRWAVRSGARPGRPPSLPPWPDWGVLLSASASDPLPPQAFQGSLLPPPSPPP